MKQSFLPVLFLIALFASFPSLLLGQTACGTAYTRIIAEGDALFKKGQYREAFEKYRAARGCTEAEHQILDQKTEDVLRAVDGEREKADRSAAMARQEQKKAETALKQAKAAKEKSEAAEKRAIEALALVEKEKSKAIAAEKTATTVLNKIYFYQDQFGLAYDRETQKYGFIDKNLNTKIEFEYHEAMPFDYSGFAWVKKLELGKQVDMLIDTLGNEYPLVYDIDKVTASTTALDLRNSELDSLPAKLFHQSQLKVLMLGFNDLTQLPTEIGDLHNLVFLGLSWNKLAQLSPALGNLRNLRTLQAIGNQLTSLPPELGNLQDLRTFQMSNNQLTSLPQELGNLRHLDYIQVSGNHLTEVPPQLGKLQELTLFDLSYNQLTQLPPELGKLKRLKSFLLPGNQLAKLPPELGQLENLSLLDLTANRLTELPSELGNLHQLASLDLNSNKLAKLPSSLGDLKNLSSLYLTANDLIELPSFLGDLKNLSVFHCEQNKLTKLPIELGRLNNLQELHLEGNPISQTEQKKIRQLLPNCNIMPELLEVENQRLYQQYFLQIQSAETRLKAGDTSVTHSNLARDYNQLAWYQLLAGKFSEAEQSVYRGLEHDATFDYLRTKLPPALLLQNSPSKEAEAIRLYEDLKDKEYHPPGYPKYRDAFLYHFKKFEEAEIIPGSRQAAVARVKKLLENQ